MSKIPLVEAEVSAAHAMATLTRHGAAGVAVRADEGYRLYSLTEIADAVRADRASSLAGVGSRRLALDSASLRSAAGVELLDILPHVDIRAFQLAPPKWVCPNGDFSALTSGSCPNDGEKLVRSGA